MQHLSDKCFNQKIQESNFGKYNSTDKYTGNSGPSAGAKNQNHNKMKALFESE